MALEEEKSEMNEEIKILIKDCKFMKAKCIDKKLLKLNYFSRPLQEFKINSKFAFFPIDDNILIWYIIDKNGQRQKLEEQNHCFGRIDCHERISCFALDPFDVNRLAIGLENGRIQVYKLPSSEIDYFLQQEDVTDEVDSKMLAQLEIEFDSNDIENESNDFVSQQYPFDFLSSSRVMDVKFHPLASDVLASTAYRSLYLWDLKQKCLTKLLNTSYQLRNFDFGHKLFGGTLITAAGFKFCDSDSEEQQHQYSNKQETGSLLIFDTRPKQPVFIYEEKFPSISKALNGKVCWAMSDTIIIASLYHHSQRMIQFYNFDLNQSPIVLPLQYFTYETFGKMFSLHFDEDLNILYLHSRGSPEIKTLLIGWSSNNDNDIDRKLDVQPTNEDSLINGHQSQLMGLDFWPKSKCLVEKQEIAIGFGLTDSAKELLMFNYIVPRYHTEYFHEKLYPPTTLTNIPLLESQQWFSYYENQTIIDSIKPKKLFMKPDSLPSYEANRARIKEEKEEQARIKRASHANGRFNYGFGNGDNIDTLMKILNSNIEEEDDEDKNENKIDGDCVDSDEWDDD